MKRRFQDDIDYDYDMSSSWMIIYSDMITIILCFFIIFFIMSAEENSVLYDLKSSLQDKVTQLSDVNKKLEEEKETLSQTLFDLTNIESDVNTSNEEFIAFLRDNDLLKDVTISQDENQLIISFKDSVLFESGEADVTMEGNEVLDIIGDKLKSIDNDFMVEGYTDNIPINTEQFPSNWELSSARAINVVKLFINDKNIDEERISFSGWGERKSIASNETEEGRSKNRRIEIKISK